MPMIVSSLKFLATIAVVMLSSSAWAAEQGSAVRGAVIVKNVCGACHGVDGNSTTDGIPKLAGQYPEYIVKQLHAFRAENRQKPHRYNATMSPVAQKLSDQNIADAATYFSQQTLAPGKARQRQNLALGEEIYTEGNAQTGLPACVTCHRPDGSGIQPEFPRLAGQRPEYIQQQLQSWPQTRGGKGKLMTLIVSFLQPKEIPAVADYVAQLRGNTAHLTGMASIGANAGRAEIPANHVSRAGNFGRSIGN